MQSIYSVVTRVLNQKCVKVLLLTIITPVSVPGVGTKPVWNTILLPPAQHLDGVTAQSRPRHMLIHTCVRHSQKQSTFMVTVVSEG